MRIRQSAVGQKHQVKKALFNLIKNAIEAMPEGGILVIEQYEDLHDIHLTISDSGIGIPNDKLRLLNIPFFTMKQDGKGMGLAQVFNTITNKAKIESQTKKDKEPLLSFLFPKNNHQIPYTGGKTTMQAIDSKVELSEFLNKNGILYKKNGFNIYRKTKAILLLY